MSGDASDLRALNASGANIAAMVDDPARRKVVEPENKLAASDDSCEAENVLPGPERVFKNTDFGNAERFARDHGGEIKYVHSWGRWLIWDGIRWKHDKVEERIQMAKKTIRSIYDEAARCQNDQRRGTLVKWALDSEFAGRVEALVKLAKSDPKVAVTHEELDRDHFCFNCQNGTIDLRTGEIRDHDPDDLITKLAPVKFDPAAECPRWNAFLNRIMGGDEELIGFIRRFAGYSMTGDVGEQCLAFLYGSGANGKSTLVEVLAAMFGDYFQKAPTSLILARKDGSEGIPNDIARLPGARLVVAAELEEGARMAESRVKDLTGGDRLVARFMRQEFFEFDPTHKLWLYGNHRPAIYGEDHGIWRRIHQIPFEVCITEDEKDPGLKDALIAEDLPGIFAWCVAGCLEWQEHGLNPPLRVSASTGDYRSDMDLVGQFLEDRIEQDSSGEMAKSELYGAYSNWCKDNGFKAMSSNRLGRRLKDRGFTDDKRGGVRVWTGYTLKPELSL